MRPRLTQLSLAVIMESTNIILVYCPPSRGLIVMKIYRFLLFRLLPPIAGIDTYFILFRVVQLAYCPPSRGLIQVLMPKKLPSSLLPPIAGIDIDAVAVLIPSITIAPIAGIDTPCRERSAAQRRRPFHTPPSTFHTPSLRSPPHFPFRRGGFCDSKTITKNIFDLTVAPPPKR